MKSSRSFVVVLALAATIFTAERPAQGVANPPDRSTAPMVRRTTQQVRPVLALLPPPLMSHKSGAAPPHPALIPGPVISPPFAEPQPQQTTEPKPQAAPPRPALVQTVISGMAAGQPNTASRTQSQPSGGTASRPQLSRAVTTYDQANTTDPWNCSTLTADVKVACIRAAIAYYDNLLYTVKQTERVYDEQYRETRIISWLLIVLFVVSLGLAIAQFILALRVGNQNLKKSIETESTVKISKDGLEVSSSILGVILLAFSIVFFYLYLQTVYQIK